mgnify:CR=1 FL=1
MVSSAKTTFVSRPTSTKGACQTTVSCRDYVGSCIDVITSFLPTHYGVPVLHLFLHRPLRNYSRMFRTVAVAGYGALELLRAKVPTANFAEEAGRKERRRSDWLRGTGVGPDSMPRRNTREVGDTH